MELSNIRGQATAPPNHLVQIMRQYPLLFYFLITFGLTWAYELLVFGVLHISFSSSWLWALLLTLVGPTLAAFLMTAVMQGRAGILQLLRRYVLWRVGIPWYLVVLLGVLALLLITYLLLPGAFSAFRLPELSFWPAYLITYLLTLVFGGPLGEEPSWRGFALPRLQQRFGPLVGTLLLGVLWGLWHLPLFLLVPGYNGAGTGFVAILIPFVAFVITVIAYAVTFTLVFNNTRGSLFNISAYSLPSSAFARLTQSEAPSLAFCPRNRFNWAACSCTWRMVYNRSSKKLIGFPRVQGKSTWWCAFSSDNPAIVVWHF